MHAYTINEDIVTHMQHARVMNLKARYFFNITSILATTIKWAMQVLCGLLQTMCVLLQTMCVLLQSLFRLLKPLCKML